MILGAQVHRIRNSIGLCCIFNDKMETLSNAFVFDTLVSCEPK